MMTVILLLLFWLSFTDAAFSAAAVVQSTWQATDGADSIITTGITTTNGNLIICDATAYYGDVLFSDSKANSYVDIFGLITVSSDAFGFFRSAYKVNAIGGAGHTFTLTAVVPNSWLAIVCKEVSGADPTAPLDKIAINADNSGDLSSYSSGFTSTTAQAGELLSGGCATPQAFERVNFTATGGFTQDQNIPHDGGEPASTIATMMGILSMRRVVSAVGTYQATCSVDNTGPDSAVAWITTWKETGAAPSAVARRRIISSGE